ncbi:MAG: MFS transporter [Deltaproteobacteria bacterium]|nr:MFS transporter [Deltaproteobacteria bacterium]
MDKKTNPLFYGWYIALVGTTAYALGYGARFSFSVIFPSLLEEFKWSRDLTATMFSVHLLIYGIAAPITGFLVDRTGPRKTMVLGAILLSLGLILSRWGNQLWYFWITFGLISGAGLCMIGAVPFTTVLRNWFEKKRGLALSLLFLGSGGAFGCYPAVAWLIDTIGWRDTYLIEGLVVGGVMIPLVLFVVRYHPRDMGLFRDGLPETKEGRTSSGKGTLRVVDPAWTAIDWTLSKAVRTGRFWLICLTTFSLWGINQNILLAHQVAFAIDMGFSKLYAASVLSLFGLTYAIGSLGSLISDRIGREVTVTLATAIGISGMIVLMFIRDASQPWMLYYFSISLGVSNGLCSPTIAAALTDIFQGPRVGPIVGAVWFAFAVGGTIGPWLGGWLFERTGDYFLAFLVATVLFAVACAALWLAAPRKVRRVS